MSEFNFEIKTEILKQVESLNLEMYVLFCKLDRYKDKMTDPIYKYMADQLFMLYRSEFGHMAKDYLLEREKERYETNSRRDILVPHRSWFFGIRNKAAKLIDKKVRQEADEVFEALKKLLSDPEDDEEESGVNERCEEAASDNVPLPPPVNLPITTLQACEELINYVAKTVKERKK